jgi:hypothetical protein
MSRRKTWGGEDIDKMLGASASALNKDSAPLRLLRPFDGKYALPITNVTTARLVKLVGYLPEVYGVKSLHTPSIAKKRKQ